MESSLHLGPVPKPTLALTALFCCPSPWTGAGAGDKICIWTPTGISTSPVPAPQTPGAGYQLPKPSEDLTAFPWGFYSGHSGYHHRPHLFLAFSPAMTLALPLSNHPSNCLFLVTSDGIASKIAPNHPRPLLVVPLPWSSHQQSFMASGPCKTPHNLSPLWAAHQPLPPFPPVLIYNSQGSLQVLPPCTAVPLSLFTHPSGL